MLMLFQRRIGINTSGLIQIWQKLACYLILDALALERTSPFVNERLLKSYLISGGGSKVVWFFFCCW